ncbi:MAG: PBP1A family penicillin-binding protein [Acidobacteria bacterium]|nr:PBP1A family penicillin-binding protein [Acidobacteriota bacterium]
MAKKRKVDFEDEEDFPVVTKHRPVAIRDVPRRGRRGRLKMFLILLVLAGLVATPILWYYYQKYSAIIDSGLQGKIFERSSGIYAAPLTLHLNSPVRQADLIRYLQGVGYVQQSVNSSDQRGRYAITATAIDITPSSEVMINNTKLFPTLRVEFGPTGIRSLTDLDKHQSLAEAQVEPERISSTINQEREKRKNIEFKDLPKSLVDAIVATEDRTFFDHSGISLRGIFRAFTRNYQAGEITEGGSTITQQLVKSFFLTPERTWKRKISEAYMAIILERKLSKEQILALYCNQIYLGQRGGFSINGFGEAARAYFGKDVSYLTLSESALLAGIIRSPNYYSPYSHEARARDRRATVLDLMVDQGKIKPEEAANAKAQSLGVIGKGGTDATDAPYFVDYVMRQLDTQYGDDSQSMRSMRVYTSIDLDLQRAAYAAVQRNLPEIDRQVMARRGTTAGLQIALVALNAKNGDILAMVGGRDYANSQLNRATDAKRQPGSVFKPFVYAAGLSESDSSRRITAASVFRDEPRSFEYDGRYYAPDNFRDSYELRTMTAREALAKSKNVITVTVAERVGFTQVASFAEHAGLPKVVPVPASALGASEATPLQVASAYTSFANQGKRAAPIAIKRLTTKEGSVLFERQPEITEAMSPQVSYIMTSILQDVLAYGTGTRVKQFPISGPVAGKTGTSRDGWFAGYSPNLVCVVWVGFDDNSDFGVTGGTTAALVWGDFMSHALAIRPELGGDFEVPSTGLVTQYVNPMGEAANIDTPGAKREIFLSGTQTGDAEALTPPPVSATPSIPQPSFGQVYGQTASIEPPIGAPTPYQPPAGSPGTTTTMPYGQSPADRMIPVSPEAQGKVSLSQPAPTPDNRSIFRRAGDAIMAAVSTKPTPVPAASAPSTSQASPQRTSTASGSRATTAGSTAAPRPTPWRAPLTNPPKQTGARPVQQQPTLRYSNGTVGPTPWPVPKQGQTTQGKQAVSAASKSAVDFRPNRPRIVPTPTPTPQKLAAAKSSKTTANQQAKLKASPTPKPHVKKELPVSAPPPKPVPVPVAAKKQFNIEVCAVSGLIPVKGLCTTRVRRSYNLGEEPTQTCTPDKHRKN